MFKIFFHFILEYLGFSGGKGPTCQCRLNIRDRVQSLGRADSLEESTSTHSRILAWRILWTPEAGGLQSMGSHGITHDSNDLVHKHITDLQCYVSFRCTEKWFSYTYISIESSYHSQLFTL